MVRDLYKEMKVFWPLERSEGLGKIEGKRERRKLRRQWQLDVLDVFDIVTNRSWKIGT